MSRKPEISNPSGICGRPKGVQGAPRIEPCPPESIASGKVLIDFQRSDFPSLDIGATGRLAKGLGMWHTTHMNATLSLDEAGRLVLPNTALRVLGMKPGDQVRADISPNRIDICPEPPVMAKGVIESGVLVMARQGIIMDAAAAVRADRDALAERALLR